MPSLVTPSTRVATVGPNAAESFSIVTSVSSSTSCRSAAISVTLSSLMSARMEATLMVWTM